MNNFNGIGANFIGRKNLYGVRKTGDEQIQKTTEKIPQNEIEKTIQRKNPEDVLNAMHLQGAQKIINPKINKIKNDPQMNQRIGEFMSSFESEVEKGLKILAKEFPKMDEIQARAIVAESVLKASDN
jgi:hypothetical protein